MSTIYERIREQRRDMTEWLIHFTRDANRQSALENLLSILTEGVLRPGFAQKGRLRRPTIYGPVPAVCFSEQPIDAYISYLTARADSSAMSGYGLFIHKHDVYAAGGLPVIYGLADAVELRETEEGYDPLLRLLRPDCIPFQEQYRYIAFAPNRVEYPMDWTHEREWRWPASASICERTQVFALGMPISIGRGLFKRRVNAFVNYDQDVRWLQEGVSIAMREDRIGHVPGMEVSDYFEYWQPSLQGIRIISLETATRGLESGNNNFARFEYFPETTKHPLLI